MPTIWPSSSTVAPGGVEEILSVFAEAQTQLNSSAHMNLQNRQ
ncbi:MAG TPA: hypothetical protein VLX60_10950 [Terriglobales bacterium]|nr:hypothetical protein [Terriglobales bacterium]